MTRLKVCAALLVALAMAAVALGCGAAKSGGEASPSSTATAVLATTTPAGSKPVSSVVWAVYREVNSLDPLYAFDYPENTAIPLMCESVLRQAPDGSIGPGLASLAYTDPTTLVFTLEPGVKFWDGHPVTADDVVFSLERQMDPALGGFFGASFSLVEKIEAAGPGQVTITLKQPDYWLEGELASIPGVVLEKAFVEKEGKNYGTPAGRIMGTGPYMFDSWTPGAGVTAGANPDYWNAAVKPLTGEIVLKGVPASAPLSSGLVTGGISGAYLIDYSILRQMEQSESVTVTRGPSWASEVLAITDLNGTLGDVKVRQALSLALDRQGIINSVYKGAAVLPRWLSNPGAFGYAKPVFTAEYEKSPLMEQDLEQAKALVKEAGAIGKSFTIGMTNEITNIAASAGAYRTAGEAIGLKVTFKAVSAQNFIYFFIDPKAREGIDAVPTLTYGNYADPAGILAMAFLPNGSSNLSGYSNPQLTALLEEARATADPDQRAKLVSEAQRIVVQDLPAIPTVQPQNIVVTNKSLTGAVASFAFMYAPWADQLGGTP